MKQRVITAIAIAAVMIPCLIFMHTIAFTILLSVISLLAVYEVIKATGGKNAPIMVISCLTAAAIPFLFNFDIVDKIPLVPVAIVYIVGYLILMVLMHEKTTFNDVVTAIFSMVAIPCSISMLIELRDVYKVYPDRFTKSVGVFLVLFSFGSSWITDIFAYQVGSKIGKHKLCPTISPKKSVEGAVGGIVGEIIFNLIMFIIFDKCIFPMHTITWWQVIIISIILSIISMFGDLSASIIKRNHGVKDFGKILPGHGGIMDRFDSCLFVTPVMYAIIFFMNV